MSHGLKEIQMYKGSIDQMTYRIGKVERMLTDTEEKIAMLDKIEEWSTEQEIEYNELCEERNWLQREFDELHEVLA